VREFTGVTRVPLTSWVTSVIPGDFCVGMGVGLWDCGLASEEKSRVGCLNGRVGEVFGILFVFG
jgi:hypothetical protein